MTRNTPPPPPAPPHLSAEAAGLWSEFHRQYDITDAHALAVFTAGLEAFDAMRRAQAVVAEHGPAVRDRFGQLRGNPAAAVERDSRGQWLQALKTLGFDIDAAQPWPGRPPNRYGHV
jgi:P27 family predicted phage terminase small subunit